METKIKSKLYRSLKNIKILVKLLFSMKMAIKTKFLLILNYQAHIMFPQADKKCQTHSLMCSQIVLDPQIILTVMLDFSIFHNSLICSNVLLISLLSSITILLTSTLLAIQIFIKPFKILIHSSMNKIRGRIIDKTIMGIIKSLILKDLTKIS